ncbi:MAG TPA: hypothetical protein VF810_01200 [Patescibacteria group bacterium]
MENNSDPIDVAIDDLVVGSDEDSRIKMSQAELLAELLYQEKSDDPLGDF